MKSVETRLDTFLEFGIQSMINKKFLFTPVKKTIERETVCLTVIKQLTIQTL